MKESPLEAEAAMLIRAAGLPEPIRQLAFGAEVGRKWKADFAWGITRGGLQSIAILEVDGGGFANGRHNRNSGREDDMVRDAYCAFRGWLLFRATPNLLRRGYAVRWVERAIGIGSYLDANVFPLGSALRPREAARRRLKARSKRLDARRGRSA